MRQITPTSHVLSPSSAASHNNRLDRISKSEEWHIDFEEHKKTRNQQYAVLDASLDKDLGPPTLEWLIKREFLPAPARAAGDAEYDQGLLRDREKLFADALQVCKDLSCPSGARIEAPSTPPQIK